MTIAKVPVTDRSFAGARATYLAGPLNLRDAKSIDRMLRQISARGPSNRFGLHPSRRSTKWEFMSADCVDWIVTEREPLLERRLIEQEMMRIAATRQNAPIELHVCGDYLIFDYDHGLGDSHFVGEIAALASGDEVSALDRWPRVTTDKPVGRAAMQLLKTGIRSVAGGVKALSAAARVAPPAISGALDAEPRIVVGSSAPGWTAVARENYAAGESAGFFAMFAVALVRSLRQNNIEVQDRAGVMVDLRRYLPDEDFTFSNFVSIVDVPTDSASTSLDVSRAMRNAFESPQLLLRHIASTGRIAVRGTSDLGPWAVAAPRIARLAFSEITPRSALAKFNWIDGADSRIVVAILPISLSDQISVSLVRELNGGVHVGLTFFDGEFSEEILRRSLAAVLDDPRLHPELWSG